MSVEAAAAFIQKVSEDEGLYASVKNLKTRKLEDLISVAASAGFAFSVEDWNAVVARVAGELSDGDLDQVAGGVVTSYSTSFQLTISPVLKTYMNPFTLAASCGASCQAGSCGTVE